MAVGVVRPDRHHRDPRAGRGEEAGIGVGAAVVGHLEHVGGQVGARGQPAFGVRPQVTGEQQPEAPLGDPHDQGQVVGLGADHGSRRVGREHLDGRGPDGAPVAGDQDGPLGTGAADQRPERRGPVVGGRQRPGGHRPDLAAAERPGQAADVVGVQVREQHQRQPVDPEPVQARVDQHRVGPGVDEQPLTGRGGQHQRVALPDVAGDQCRRRGWPAAADLPHRPAHEDDPDHRGQREQPPPGPPQQRPEEQPEHRREQQRTARATGPADRAVGHRGGPLADRDQPAHRPARQPGQQVPGGRPPRPGQRREQAQHRGRRDRRRGQQVGRQGDQADRAGQRHDQRCGGQPRGRGDRERVGERTGQPPGAQRARPGRRQQHDRRGRGHRQREAGVAREPGTDQQQDRHRRGQRGDRRPAAPRGEGQQGDPAHRRRAQHAGLRPGQHHEPDEPGHGHQCLQAAVRAAQPEWPEQQGQHDRDIGPGHGGEVRQPGPAELLGQLGVHPAGVTDDEPGQQPGRAGRQHPVRRGGEPGAHRCRQPLQTGRAGELRGRGAGGQQRHHVVPGLGGAHRGPDPQRLPGAHLLPLGGRPEQQHRLAGDRRAIDGGHGRRQQHPRLAGAGERAGVGVGPQHQPGHPAVGRQPGQRRTRPHVGPHRGDGADRGQRGQAARQQHGASPAARAAAQQQRHQDEGGPGGQRERCRPEPGREQRGDPDRRRRRHQAEVQPGPPALVGATDHPQAAHVRPAAAVPAAHTAPGRCR